jgi:FkbM family methyltransferase
VTLAPETKSLRRRPPFLWKLGVSLRKRRLRLQRWWGLLHGGSEDFTCCRYYGAEFLVRSDDVIAHEMLLRRFEWRQIERMIEVCRRLRPAVFIDIGANFGLYTCILGRQGLVPRLVAIEPDRKNLIHLRMHLQINDPGGAVEVHECAAGARTGEALLTPSSGRNCGLSHIAVAGGAGYRVRMAAIDEIVSLEGQPICVKIDVEGFELAVLAGMGQLFRRNHGYAQIEVLGDDDAAVIGRMAEFGWGYVGRIDEDSLFERDAV